MKLSYLKVANKVLKTYSVLACLFGLFFLLAALLFFMEGVQILNPTHFGFEINYPLAYLVCVFIATRAFIWSLIYKTIRSISMSYLQQTGSCIVLLIEKVAKLFIASFLSDIVILILASFFLVGMHKPEIIYGSFFQVFNEDTTEWVMLIFPNTSGIMSLCIAISLYALGRHLKNYYQLRDESSYTI